MVGADDAKTYGDGVTLEQAVAIEALMQEPEKYAGKKVRVDGVITGVCKNRGCWMQVTDPESGKGIRVKVEDGVIVFPYTAMGHKTSAEGVFEVITLSPEQVAEMKARHAKAEGSAGCDKDRASTAPEQKGKDVGCGSQVHDDKVYIIRGTGAVIHA
jgi:hypothetical protein